MAWWQPSAEMDFTSVNNMDTVRPVTRLLRSNR